MNNYVITRSDCRHFTSIILKYYTDRSGRPPQNHWITFLNTCSCSRSKMSAVKVKIPKGNRDLCLISQQAATVGLLTLRSAALPPADGPPSRPEVGQEQ